MSRLPGSGPAQNQLRTALDCSGPAQDPLRTSSGPRWTAQARLRPGSGRLRLSSGGLREAQGGSGRLRLSSGGLREAQGGSGRLLAPAHNAPCELLSTAAGLDVGYTARWASSDTTQDTSASLHRVLK
ncbi:hypothetical protein CPLU01_15822 [Colletotrichum plurivorum]|uniref:Uncharacterized protein n=1 Tax=Colletotrichum plurivorum TaxID=2175906 RepID=A0A8H6J6V1_9PEZI|nr:hypothetical protein CPLU01_15822 [Colletotrichum plurivorum]